MHPAAERHGAMVGSLLAPLILLTSGALTFSPTDPAQLGLGVDPPTAPDGPGPWFAADVSRNVSASLGRTAYLVCRVHQLANRSVSWVRVRDVHLLSVGQSVYTNDERFRVSRRQRDWTLQIKFVQRRDAGAYACQVNAEPAVSYLVHLSVVEPVTELLGGPELYIDTASTINLTCVVRRSPQPPPFIFWRHDDQVVGYESARAGVSVTGDGDVTVSSLVIRSARASDSGVYSCHPSGADAAARSLRVHVLQGDQPAAMQTSSCPPLPGALVVTLALLHLALHWDAVT